MPVVANSLEPCQEPKPAACGPTWLVTFQRWQLVTQAKTVGISISPAFPLTYPFLNFSKSTLLFGLNYKAIETCPEIADFA
jgi:hypothetical protein